MSGANGEYPRRTGSMLFGVEFSASQNAALAADERSPRWDLNPPQREEYDCDYGYALGLRQYADRLIASNAPISGGTPSAASDGCDEAKK